MRLELALIVGIIFFCCWCAYIIAKMNSSVPSATPYELQQQPQLQPQQQQPANAADMQQQYPPQSHPQAQFAAQTPGGSSNQSSVQFVWASAAAPPLSPQLAAQHLAPPSEGLQMSWPPPPPPHGFPNNASHVAGGRLSAPYVSQPASGNELNNLWPAHYANRLYAQPQAAAGWPPPAPSHDDRSQYLAAPSDQYGRHAYQPEELADPDPDPDADSSGAATAQEPDDYAAAAGEDSEGDGNGAVGDEQLDAEPVNTELEERSGGRSFSEDEADTNERDADGVLVRETRRHLINGRPAGEHQSGGERRRREKEAKAADFERIVDEIEGSGSSSGKRPAQASDEEDSVAPSGSSSLPVAAGAKVAKSGGKISRRRDVSPTGGQRGARPVKRVAVARSASPAGDSKEKESGVVTKRRRRAPKDSHKHQLRETLTAQQWDDDVATVKANGEGSESVAAAAATTVTPSEQMDPSQRSIETETPPPTSTLAPIEFEDLDLLARDEFPFMEPEAEREEEEEEAEAEMENAGSGRRRKKRQAADGWAQRTTSATSKQQQELKSPALPTSRHPKQPSDVGESVKATGDSPGVVTLGSTSAEPLAPSSSSLAQMSDANPGHGNATAADITTAKMPETPFAGLSQASDAKQTSLAGEDFGANRSSKSAPNSLDPLEPQERDPFSHQPVEDPVRGAEDMSIEVLAPNPGGGGTRMPPADVYATISPAPLATAQIWPPTPTLVQAPPRWQPPESFYGPAHPAQSAGGNEGTTGRDRRPLASSSKKVRRKKKMKKMKKSKVHEAKHKGAAAMSMKRGHKFKKGNMSSKKAKARKKLAQEYKAFKGSTRGKKGSRGSGQKGAKKGNLYYKDKGYKKRGFKKAYQKVEAGDHKTYFDEFRDKDHKKKWKQFKDGHDYSQRKYWAGKDKKLHKSSKSHDMRHKKKQMADWKLKAKSEQKRNFKHKKSQVAGKKLAKVSKTS